MRKIIPWILLIGVVVIALVGIGIQSLKSPYIPGGSVIDPPAPAPEIQLTDYRGLPFSLNDLRGNIVLLFFGYTNCPDVCPTTLSDMKFVFNQLEAETGGLSFVFVTVDPARDSAERLESYLSGFNPDFIGLTGSDAALEIVYQEYNVGVNRAPAAGVPGYEVEHISRIFVIDRDGRLIETFPYGLDRENILQDVQHLIENGGF